MTLSPVLDHSSRNAPQATWSGEGAMYFGGVHLASFFLSRRDTSRFVEAVPLRRSCVGLLLRVCFLLGLFLRPGLCFVGGDCCILVSIFVLS